MYDLRAHLFRQPFDNFLSSLFAIELNQALFATFFKVRYMPKFHGGVPFDAKSVAYLGLHDYALVHFASDISV